MISIIIRLPMEARAIKGNNVLLFPEAFLHPEEAMDRMDEILNGSQSITILTNSEAMVLRALRRIGEGKFTPQKDISFGCLHRGEVLPLRANEMGQFIDAVPGGFFEYRLNELCI